MQDQEIYVDEGNIKHKRIHKFYPPIPDVPVAFLSDKQKRDRIAKFKEYFKYRLTNLSSAPMYSTPDDLQLMIDDYFDTVAPETIDINKGGKTITIKPYTLTGLIMHIGYNNKTDFYDLQNEPTYARVVKQARTRIEQHYEKLLQSGLSAGPIFALKNMTWTDKTVTDINQTVKEIKIVVNDQQTADKLALL
jgi:hypothetical protein